MLTTIRKVKPYDIISRKILMGSEIGIILPTYREAENISRLIDDIENLKLNCFNTSH